MNKKNEQLSRRARYKSVAPGGFVSRNYVNDNENKNNNSDTIRRTAPKRSRYNEIEEDKNTQRVYKRNSQNRPVNNNLTKKEDKRNIAKKRISKPNKPRKNKKWLAALIKYCLYLASIGTIALFLICVYWIYQAPEFNSSLLDNNNRTIVYDINDKEVAKLGNKIGDNAEMSEVPQQMQDAILATEDNRFFEHGAVDYRRLVGAIFSNITSGFGSQGASTISQQLIKRIFLDDNKHIKRKVQEAYLAYKLEQNYDKETIFNMYINRIYYSDGVYGLKTAANYYYGKELSALSLPQTALLAGIPQQPNGYNPYDHPENAKKRRDTVLYLMKYHGKISEEEANAAEQVDITDGLVRRDSSNRFILSSEFDESLTAYMSQVAMELRNSKEYRNYDGDVLNLGLKVYTNLDTNIQKSVYNSMANNSVGIKNSSDIAMVVLNNENSGVSALYGGRNFKFGGFNYATQAKLQPGSSIKPILAYGPAVEYLGWATNQMIEDKKIPGSEIQNWDRKYHGNVTMNYALMMSFNIPAIKTYQAVGFNNIRKYANSVGLEVTDDSITTPIGGSADGYSPLQMAGAYVPFSNGGYYATPKTVRKVFDNEGFEIASFNSNDRKQVIKDTTAYIMTSMLRNVISGTAQYSAVGGVDMGVKTGTTTFSVSEAEKFGFDVDNYSKDSWVIGYTSKYTMAVWQGFDTIDDNKKFMTSQDNVKTQMLYKTNMQSIARLYPPKAFTAPNNVGTYNGGLKVLTNEEKSQLEAQARKEEEAKKEEENKKAAEAEKNNNSTNNSNNRNNDTATINSRNTTNNSNNGG
ncbi:penicillin-binding protein [Gemella sp. zg-570]|uniref:transglycosylase domain-containing protein n=1 Tax=Gemella sp. zg-570 TaxID=2840371 RepID=UPI001C0DEFED|nr:transglycosylase domain-containing protein [Gemella sp. zg-570]QWQ38495.1 penicillin-binding protein [Gemella sp. zg-570]